MSLQRALLPERLVEHPDFAVAALYRPSDERLEVGGDWYDTLTLPGGRIGVAVGDVVGHGLEAAAAMGQLRTAVAALAPDCASPDDAARAARRLRQAIEGCATPPPATRRSTRRPAWWSTRRPATHRSCSSTHAARADS